MNFLIHELKKKEEWKNVQLISDNNGMLAPQLGK